MKNPSPGKQFALTVVVVSFIAAIGIFFAGRWLSGGPAAPQFAGTSTESEFSRDVVEGIDKNSPAWSAGYFRDEWPAARSVHKIVAYTIARCSQIDINQMSPSIFTALMLDLRPDGSHMWANTSASQKDPNNISLTPYQQTILAISDGVAQARIAAAKGADNFYPNMIQFGWAAVIVSALATMFVTLRSSLKAPLQSDQKTYVWYAGATSFYAVGFLAIALSTASTILAGAKQFWDPTGAYMRNEGALVSLRQVHAEIVLDSVAHMDEKCTSTENADTHTAKVARWVSTLVSLQPGTVTAPVLIAAPSSSQVSSPVVMVSDQRPSGGGDAANPPPSRQQPGVQPSPAHAPPPR
jgi:hypothetical protein